MISKPEIGYVTINIDGYEDTASYVSSVMVQILQECLDYFNGKRFSLTFDAEGHEFGVVVINGELYYWSNITGTTNVFLIYKDLSLREGIIKIAKDAIASYEENEDAWMNFECVDESDYEEIETTLTKLCINLEDKINKPYRELEIGNLLFGNSRGEYPIPRGEWQAEFWKFLEECGFDSYGNIEKETLEANLKTIYSDVNNKDYEEHTHYFENDIFKLMPYYWGDADNICAMPNFIYKPCGFELSWYKYPLRDAWSNQNITLEEFKEILNKCKQSL